MWYTRDEQALVIGSFYSMNGFQQCVGGLIAYGIAHVEHAKLKNWQILFTVRHLNTINSSGVSSHIYAHQLLGCITFVWGIFVAWWLPDSPMRATCFLPEDRVLLAERVRKNETGIQNREFKVSAELEARFNILNVNDRSIKLVSLKSAQYSNSFLVSCFCSGSVYRP